MAFLSSERHYKCLLFTTTCILLHFAQTTTAQDDYVDFLRKANDRLTLKALSAFAGNLRICNCLWFCAHLTEYQESKNITTAIPV